MTKLLSSADAAAILGVSPDQVPRHARRLGVGQKIGGSWVFSAADVRAMKKTVRGRAGNPNFSKKT